MPSRLYAYGYAKGEVRSVSSLPEPSAIKPSARIFENPAYVDSMVRDRRPVQVSSGMNWKRLANPHANYDGPTIERGVRKRFLHEPPPCDAMIACEFTLFVKEWLRKNLEPLPESETLDLESWLLKTHYTEARKNQLRQTYDEVYGALGPQSGRVKMFMKDETYGEFKWPRAINARSDRFKVIFGPIVKAIEMRMYSLPNFIKHVPVAERPLYISRLLGHSGAKYVSTDYSSFEALFRKWLMDSCENTMIRYMAQNLATADLKACLGQKSGCNKVVSSYMDMVVEATRMSGEMDTSLSNSFANLMVFLFVAQKSDARVEVVVEGDDGLAAVLAGEIEPKYFLHLGLEIKIQFHEQLSSASFCGLIFDEEDLINITDPIKVLLNFGWLSARYAGARHSKLLSLLRVKAMSCAVQYPGCPIIEALAVSVLRMTSGHEIRPFLTLGSEYERERKAGLAAVDWANRSFIAPPPRTRALMELVFKIPVGVQVSVERYLLGLEHVCELELGQLDTLLHPDVIEYSAFYLNEMPINRSSLPFPVPVEAAL
jgi:hypothetical protein